jgi:hypothetical protein
VGSRASGAAGRNARSMKTEIKLDIQAQPDEESCGPTCLYSLYRSYGDTSISLRKVSEEVERLDVGGTLIEVLACHALRRGYDATIYTYHIQMFDPTWFADDGLVHDAADVSARLQEQLKFKRRLPRLGLATRTYQEFLRRGGQLRMQDLTPHLIQGHLAQGNPIITGLSSTYLYRLSREIYPGAIANDIRGEPQGHFVMLVGYDSRKREVLVADPLSENPPFHTAKFRLSMDRLMSAILLGILTHDANLLVIRPRAKQRARKAAKGSR